MNKLPRHPDRKRELALIYHIASYVAGQKERNFLSYTEYNGFCKNIRKEWEASYPSEKTMFLFPETPFSLSSAPSISLLSAFSTGYPGGDRLPLRNRRLATVSRLTETEHLKITPGDNPLLRMVTGAFSVLSQLKQAQHRALSSSFLAWDFRSSTAVVVRI